MVGRPLSSLYPPRNADIGKPVLQVTGLGRSNAFSDISFTLRQGEVLGFAGLVGAGRTEIMRAIFGLDPYDAGTIEIDGMPVRFAGPADAIRAGLAFVTESRKDDGLVLSLSGRENIVLNGILLGLTRREVLDRVQDIIAFSELQEFIDAPLRTYSTGMVARLGFSVAVHLEPAILLVDEALAVGDVRFRAELRSSTLREPVIEEESTRVYRPGLDNRGPPAPAPGPQPPAAIPDPNAGTPPAGLGRPQGF